MQAEKGGVCSADADSFPTGDAKQKIMHFNSVLTFFPKPWPQQMICMVQGNNLATPIWH